jgi:hypothetical protein
MSSQGSLKAKAWESSIAYQSMIRWSYPPNPTNQETANEGSVESLLNSPHYDLEPRGQIPWALLINPIIMVSCSDHWTPSFSVPRLYDAVALLCHFFLVAMITLTRPHEPTIIEPRDATTRSLHRPLPRMVLDDRYGLATTLKGKALRPYHHFTTSRLPFELDITISLPDEDILHYYPLAKMQYGS